MEHKLPYEIRVLPATW